MKKKIAFLIVPLTVGIITFAVLERNAKKKISEEKDKEGLYNSGTEYGDAVMHASDNTYEKLGNKLTRVS